MASSPSLRVLVSGASGLVGGALTEALTIDGHHVEHLVRSPASPGVRWDPAAGLVDAKALAGFDAVVHLAGENIAEGRWTDAKKARIRGSRVDGTRLLCEALATAPPRVFVGASAIGYYGSRGDEVMVESSAPGDDFLADVCVAWEQASAALESKCRVVRPRIGVVLSTNGGALAKMRTPFRLGLGGRIGSGRQWMSWISIDDLVAVLRHCLTDDGLVGPCNAVAPQPVTNAEFTAALGHALRRPTLLPMPALAARALFGEMGDALLLSSTRVAPQALEQRGFRFRHPDVTSALHALLAD
ncbi:MAG: TIGR01777 family oxidoreductase [Planctomycetota bacterium]